MFALLFVFLLLILLTLTGMIFWLHANLNDLLALSDARMTSYALSQELQQSSDELTTAGDYWRHRAWHSCRKPGSDPHRRCPSAPDRPP